MPRIDREGSKANAARRPRRGSVVVARAGILLAAALFAIAVPFSSPLPAAELVMFESAGCTWCAAWEREVGQIYHKTAEAGIAPLRRVDIAAPRPADLSNIRGVIYTPTFVLMDDGREVGRILGYPGEAHFWGLLGMELRKLPQSSEG